MVDTAIIENEDASRAWVEIREWYHLFSQEFQEFSGGDTAWDDVVGDKYLWSKSERRRAH